MDNQKGNVSLVQLISWGIGIASVTSGLLWARVTATDSDLSNFKAKVAEDKAIYSADISSIKTNIENINTTLGRIDNKLK